MDDYQETRLHEPDPKPEEAKALRKRRAISWVLYAFIVVTVLVCAYAVFHTR
jgi:hypothetical protein